MIKGEIIYNSPIVFDTCKWRLKVAHLTPLYVTWEYCGGLTNNVWMEAKSVPLEVLQGYLSQLSKV